MKMSRQDCARGKEPKRTKQKNFSLLLELLLVPPQLVVDRG